jgi:hypothetical protein
MTALAEWRAKDHPRVPGGRKGGQFTSKPGGGTKALRGVIVTPMVVPGEGFPGQTFDKIQREITRTGLIDVQDQIQVALDRLHEGDLTETALALRAASEMADMGGEDETGLALSELAAFVEKGAATYDGLNKGVSKIMDRGSPTVVKALGGGGEMWDGAVRTTDDNAMGWALADINPEGRVRFAETTAKQLTGDMAAKGNVEHPAAWTVPLHELIHGVTPTGKAVSADFFGRDTTDQDIEEGFTELGTIAHAPEFFDALGVGDRPTPILAVEREGSQHVDPARGRALEFRLRVMAKTRGQREYALAERAVRNDDRAEAEKQIRIAGMADTRSTETEVRDLLNSIDEAWSQIPDNPAYGRRKAKLADALSLESTKLHGRAVAPMGKLRPDELTDVTQLEQLSKAMGRAITDLAHDDLEGAQEEISRLTHQGDLALSADAGRFLADLDDLSRTPMSKHATMDEYARRLQDHSRIMRGDVWGHYPDETAKANGWVTMAALIESKPGVAGSAIQARAFELADEINRVGSGDKATVMARQVLRSLGMTDAYMNPEGRNDPSRGRLLSHYLAGVIHQEWQTERPEDVWFHVSADARGWQEKGKLDPLEGKLEVSPKGSPKAAASPKRGRTETGRKAYAVLAWVNEAPGRAEEGLDKLRKIGADAPDTASLHEVQDVAGIVIKLVGRDD